MGSIVDLSFQPEQPLPQETDDSKNFPDYLLKIRRRLFFRLLVELLLLATKAEPRPILVAVVADFLLVVLVVASHLREQRIACQKDRHPVQAQAQIQIEVVLTVVADRVDRALHLSDHVQDALDLADALRKEEMGTQVYRSRVGRLYFR